MAASPLNLTLTAVVSAAGTALIEVSSPSAFWAAGSLSFSTNPSSSGVVAASVNNVPGPQARGSAPALGPVSLPPNSKLAIAFSGFAAGTQIVGSFQGTYASSPAELVAPALLPGRVTYDVNITGSVVTIDITGSTVNVQNVAGGALSTISEGKQLNTGSILAGGSVSVPVTVDPGATALCIELEDTLQVIGVTVTSSTAPKTYMSMSAPGPTGGSYLVDTGPFYCKIDPEIDTGYTVAISLAAPSVAGQYWISELFQTGVVVPVGNLSNPLPVQAIVAGTDAANAGRVLSAAGYTDPASGLIHLAAGPAPPSNQSMGIWGGPLIAGGGIAALTIQGGSLPAQGQIIRAAALSAANVNTSGTTAGNIAIFVGLYDGTNYFWLPLNVTLGLPPSGNYPVNGQASISPPKGILVTLAPTEVAVYAQTVGSPPAFALGVALTLLFD